MTDADFIFANRFVAPGTKSYWWFFELADKSYW